MGFFSSIFGGSSGQQNDAIKRANQAAATAQNQGNELQGQFNQQYDQYGNLTNDYRNQADQAYGTLQQTPGYTSEQAAQIQGNPNAGFNYYNPGALNEDVSGYQGGLNTAAAHGAQVLQAAPDNETQWQAGINSQLEDTGNKNLSALSKGVGSSVNQYGTALGGAVGEYGTGLDEATDPSKLSIGDQLNGYAMTPEEEQNIRNVAAQTTQGQYGKMQQEALMRANAQGNTSPAALAAIESQLGREGAINAGNAASSAELGANAEAARRQLTGVQANLGANQTLAAMQAQNASNLYGAKSNAAANLYGAQSGAAKDIYGAGSQQAQNLAQVQQSGVQSITGNQANAAAQEAAMGYNAAQQGGAQKIATDTGQQQVGQGLATGADAAATSRAKGIADTSIAGQNNYRQYLGNQQVQAQQGQQNAGNQQLGAYGAQTGAVNNANATAAGTANQGASNTGVIGNFVSGVAQVAASPYKVFADGGGVDCPTDAVIGERGPEVVVSYGKSKYMADGGTVQPTQGPQSMSMDQMTRQMASQGTGMGQQAPMPPTQPTYAEPTYENGTNSQQGAQMGAQSSQGAYGTQQGAQQSSWEHPPQPGQQQGGYDRQQGQQQASQQYGSSPISAEETQNAGKAAGSILGAWGQQQNSPQGGYGNPTGKTAENYQNMANGMAGALQQNHMGAQIPGNEPGGAQGQQGWMGNAANQMAEGGPSFGSRYRQQGGYAPQGGGSQQQSSWEQQPQTKVFTKPTHVRLGDNGTDTVVPLNPGPNAKVTMNQMPQQVQQQVQSQMAPQQQARMPSKYRPATGPKGVYGPGQRPMGPMQPQSQYAAA